MPDLLLQMFEVIEAGNTRHPKCKGYMINTPDAYEFDCGYDTELTCDQCKYGAWGGRKDPEAKCNQSK